MSAVEADVRDQIAQDLMSESASCRQAFRDHNAGRDLSQRAPIRPDLQAWADAFEAAARIARGGAS